MPHAPSTFIRAALLGVLGTAGAIDLVSVIVRSSWVLPLGSLLGALVTITMLLWGPWKISAREAIRGIGQDMSRGGAVISFALGGLLVCVFSFLTGTLEIRGICTRQANCGPDDWFNLTVFGLFFTFLALSWLFVALTAWERLHRPSRE